MSGSWIFHDLPLEVILAQRQWDRRHRARIARVHNKATYAAIARGMGLSLERVRSLVAKAERDVERRRKCPAEQYLAKADADILALAAMK